MKENGLDIDSLIAAFLSGELVAEERLLLEHWLEESTEHRELLETYQKLWAMAGECSFVKEKETEEALSRVRKELAKSLMAMNGEEDKVKSSGNDLEQQQCSSSPKIRNIVYVLSGVAATLLIIIGFAWHLNFPFNGEKTVFYTPNGSRAQVVLPDGSTVRLNVGSYIVFQYDYFRRVRRVFFKGEGYFNVAKNKGPFTITTQEGMKVTVLGTQFNLKAYPEDPDIKTTLIEGKVHIDTPQKQELMMAPGQTVRYDKKTGQLGLSEGETNSQCGWMINKLYMDNMSLTAVSKTLERWYNVRIYFSRDVHQDKIHYTGILREESVDDILDALSSLSNIRYRNNNGTIIISNK